MNVLKRASTQTFKAEECGGYIYKQNTLTSFEKEPFKVCVTVRIFYLAPPLYVIYLLEGVQDKISVLYFYKLHVALVGDGGSFESS